MDNICLRGGEVAEQKAQRQRNVGHDVVERPGHDLLARHHFHLRGGDVEVRMRQIAGSVLAVQAVELLFALPLYRFGVDVAFALLGDGLTDLAFLRLEVVRNLLRLVLLALVGKNRGADELTRRVGRAFGRHQILAVLDLHQLGLQVGGAIGDFRVAEQIRHLARRVEPDRVARRVHDGRLDVALAAPAPQRHHERIARGSRLQPSGSARIGRRD